MAAEPGRKCTCGIVLQDGTNLCKTCSEAHWESELQLEDKLEEGQITPGKGSAVFRTESIFARAPNVVRRAAKYGTTNLTALQVDVREVLDRISVDMLNASDSKVTRTQKIVGAAMLALFPLVRSLRMIGGRWAQDQSSFSAFLPVVSASLLAGVVDTCIIVFRYGMKELLPLCSKSYLLVICAASLSGFTLCFQNIALKYVEASVVTSIAQCSVLCAVMMQFGIFRVAPSKTQVLLIIATLTSVCQYSLQKSDGDNAGDDQRRSESRMGVLSACMASLMLASYGIGFQYATGKAQGPTPHSMAHTLRCMLCRELGCLMSAIVMMSFLERDFIFDRGLLSGWSFDVFAASALPLAASTNFQAILVMSKGAITTRVAATLEIVFVYAFELTVMGTTSWDSTTALLLLSLLCTSLAYNLSALEVVNASVRATNSVLSRVKAEMLGDKVSPMKPPDKLPAQPKERQCTDEEESRSVMCDAGSKVQIARAPVDVKQVRNSTTCSIDHVSSI